MGYSRTDIFLWPGGVALDGPARSSELGRSSASDAFQQRRLAEDSPGLPRSPRTTARGPSYVTRLPRGLSAPGKVSSHSFRKDEPSAREPETDTSSNRRGEEPSARESEAAPMRKQQWWAVSPQ
ncbi:unnamed protein product [Prorocentrum cordatum]|uniref:Uncharacterized protein n=1 Tax=Prorocentrum cordatum TaxID=2364126 RepID=A0ABN9W443_9DINO|nr:unnamed protein product [Polarella glacialis]